MIKGVSARGDEGTGSVLAGRRGVVSSREDTRAVAEREGSERKKEYS